MSRRVPLRCRLFGHKSTAHRFVASRDLSGRPYDDGLFTIAARCIRCRTDMTLTVPDRFTIYRAE